MAFYRIPGKTIFDVKKFKNLFVHIGTVFLNYFAAKKGKSLICRVFIVTDMILFCLYVEF